MSTSSVVCARRTWRPRPAAPASTTGPALRRAGTARASRTVMLVTGALLGNRDAGRRDDAPTVTGGAYGPAAAGGPGPFATGTTRPLPTSRCRTDPAAACGPG